MGIRIFLPPFPFDPKEELSFSPFELIDLSPAMVDAGERNMEELSDVSTGKNFCKDGFGTDSGSGRVAELRIFANSGGTFGGGKLMSS